MTFDPDINDDCLLVDGTETVTFLGTATVSVAGAKRGVLSQSELKFQEIAIEPTDATWNLPDVNLAGTVPRDGDTIEQGDGTRWTVLSVTNAALTGVWRAVCRRHR